ncbi:MAG: glycosyl transferase [Acidimicrobiales bacterium]
MSDPVGTFAHLLRLSDDRGVFEHARNTVPLPEHGYCVDDVARALLMVMREPAPEPAVAALGERCLSFVASAQSAHGEFHNRLGRDGRWQDAPGTGDWWGRALWALGATAARHPNSASQSAARAGVDLGAPRRSPFRRSMAFAILGAVEVVEASGIDAELRALLVDGVAAVGHSKSDPSWPWPEARLSYANAVLPEALIAAGTALGDDDVVADGLRLLSWLLSVETNGDHFSPTAVGGWGPNEQRAVFDQQPIEVAAFADACARAFSATGDPQWQDGLDRAISWFAGNNDAGLALRDPRSGGGFDGLTAGGINTNQGAESTMALISVAQHARRLATL